MIKVDEARDDIRRCNCCRRCNCIFSNADAVELSFSDGRWGQTIALCSDCVKDLLPILKCRYDTVQGHPKE